MNNSGTSRSIPAMLIEILVGICGFLGVGYLSVGLIADGIIRMIIWWIILLTASILVIFTLGLGAIVIIPLLLIGPLISGLMLKNRVEQIALQNPQSLQYTNLFHSNTTYPPEYYRFYDRLFTTLLLVGILLFAFAPQIFSFLR